MKKRTYILSGVVLVSGFYFATSSLTFRSGTAYKGEVGPHSGPVTPEYIPSAAEQMALGKLQAGALEPSVVSEQGMLNISSVDRSLVLDERLTDPGNGFVERVSLVKMGGSYPYWRIVEQLKFDAAQDAYVVSGQYMEVADHILVNLHEGFGMVELEELNRRYGTKTLKDMGFANKYIVQLPEPTLDGIFEFKELFDAEQQWVASVSFDMIFLPAATTPNDTNYGSQWGHGMIGSPTAWDIETGDTNIIVAVLDTGVDLDHPDLAAHIWRNPGEAGALASNGIDDDNNGYKDDWIGWDFGRSDNDPDDNGDENPSVVDRGHGTHCAGILGAIGNNGLQVAGVCWNVTIMAVKPFEYISAIGRMSAYSSKTELAMKYAADNGAKVTSNSYGGGGSMPPEDYSGINYQKNRGVLFVAAAGNDGTDNDVIHHWPSDVNLPNVISVGNSTSSDAANAGSNYGDISVDLFAPGTGIRSTVHNGTIAYKTGTSMACPMVAGALALLYSQNPDLSWQDCKAAIMDTVTVKSAFTGKCVSNGRLNLAAAMELVNLGDRDEDGIPDDWEQLYYGNPTGADPAAMAANGINTVLEAYFAGISPVSPTARFEIETIREAALPGQHILEWDSADGRMYVVYWTPNLKHSLFQPVFTNYTGSGFTDTVHSAQSVGFYRINVGIAPDE